MVKNFNFNKVYSEVLKATIKELTNTKENDFVSIIKWDLCNHSFLGRELLTDKHYIKEKIFFDCNTKDYINSNVYDIVINLSSMQGLKKSIYDIDYIDLCKDLALQVANDKVLLKALYKAIKE